MIEEADYQGVELALWEAMRAAGELPPRAMAATIRLSAGQIPEIECRAYVEPTEPGQVERLVDVIRKLVPLDRVERLAHAVDLAWGLIANVSGGDWSQQSEEWQAKAACWRDQYAAESEPGSAR